MSEKSIESKKKESEGIIDWVASNKTATSAMIALFTAIIAIPSTMLGTWMERRYLSQEAEITAQAKVFKHFAQSQNDYFDNVWVIKIKNNADFAAQKIVFDFPAKGIVEVKNPRMKAYTSKLTEEGIKIGELRKGDVAELKIWTNIGSSEVDYSKIRVTHPKGDANVEIYTPPNENIFIIATLMLIVTLLTLVCVSIIIEKSRHERKLKSLVETSLGIAERTSDRFDELQSLTTDMIEDVSKSLDIRDDFIEQVKANTKLKKEAYEFIKLYLDELSTKHEIEPVKIMENIEEIIALFEEANEIPDIDTNKLVLEDDNSKST